MVVLSRFGDQEVIALDLNSFGRTLRSGKEDTGLAQSRIFSIRDGFASTLGVGAGFIVWSRVTVWHVKYLN